MDELDFDTLQFFGSHLSALPIYERLETALFALFPEAKKRVQKTQITFFNRYVFACVSFLRARRKAELPDPFLTLSLLLPYPLDSPRVAEKTEPYPGRWTTHIVLGAPEDIDEELLSWLKEAYCFSNRK